MNDMMICSAVLQARDTLIECGFLGTLAAAMVLVMGLVTSVLVLRPLSRLSLLMRRLTELDFAHDSVECPSKFANGNGEQKAKRIKKELKGA